MSDLAYWMFGAGSMFWCAFSFNPDTEFFKMRIDNTQTDEIKIVKLHKNTLFLM